MRERAMTPEQRRAAAIAKAEFTYRRRLETASDEMRSAGIELDAARAAANQVWLREIEMLEAGAGT